MTRKRKQKCIKGLSASASSHLRKRVRDELIYTAEEFIAESQWAQGSLGDHWTIDAVVQIWRARYNRARALAAECGV